MASVIRGSDNFDSLVHQGIGVNQTWQNVTASRSLGVTYTNSTGKPIQVHFTSTAHVDTISASFYINGNSVSYSSSGFSMDTIQFSFIIPNGSTYSISCSSGNNWWELR